MLAVVMLASMVACGDSEDEISYPDVPDSVNYFDSGKEFNYYTYKSIDDGSFTMLDGDHDTGESYLTKEYIKEYFESGMKFLCLQVVATGKGPEEFEGSNIEKVLDICHELGYDKSVVLTDNQIYSPYHTVKAQYETGSLKGETDWSKFSIIGNASWQYKSEAELDAFFEERMSAYASHPAFQGVYMPDEPGARYMKVIGETYRSLRRVQKKLGLEEMFININMLPYYSNLVNTSYPAVPKTFVGTTEEKQHEAYRLYIDSYFKETQADYVQVDIYPMLEEHMYRLYFINMQILAEVAKEHDAKIIVLNQTHSNVGQRMTTYESINFMNNLSYGFGAVNNAYYAYFPLDDGSNGGVDYIHRDDGSMITRFGEKTAIYDVVKELNTKGQELAKSILNFDYTTHAIYYGDDVNTLLDAIDYAENFLKNHDVDEFAKLVDYKINKEYGIVTELYDAEKGNYMYMAFNATDPLNKGSVVYQTATLTFTSEYNKALVFFEGKYTVVDLDASHSLSVKMAPGQAHYIIPFAG